jgi:hypothetical protein
LWSDSAGCSLAKLLPHCNSVAAVAVVVDSFVVVTDRFESLVLDYLVSEGDVAVVEDVGVELQAEQYS